MLAAVLAVGCGRRSGPAPVAPRAADADAFLMKGEASGLTRTTSVAFLEREGTGRVRLVGWKQSPANPVAAGSRVELEHVFEALEPFRTDVAIAVELRAPGATSAVVVDAHRPIQGKAALPTWKPGERWRDVHAISLPKRLPATELEVWLSLVDSGTRATPETPPGAQDGRGWAKLGVLSVDPASAEAPDDGLPRVVVPRASGPIVADGKLDEGAWNRAPVLTFADSLGRDGTVTQRTLLRLLWDDTNLYVGFFAEDRDVTDPYANRDDPIYDHETVEVFLMPHVRAPALGPYVELQASPKGLIFDASFTARRQGMDKAWNAAQTVGTTIKGTLNEPSPDEAWISEWVVPWASLRYVRGAPKAGDEWRLNAFRIATHRDGGKTVGEYSAWSPPMVGDFHNTEKFGRLVFGP